MCLGSFYTLGGGVQSDRGYTGCLADVQVM